MIMKILFIFFLILFPCKTLMATDVVVYPEVPRINAVLAYQKFQTGKTILIDAMDPQTFARRHIIGAINLPNDGPEDRQRIREMVIPFPPDQEILVYCG